MTLGLLRMATQKNRRKHPNRHDRSWAFKETWSIVGIQRDMIDRFIYFLWHLEILASDSKSHRNSFLYILSIQNEERRRARVRGQDCISKFCNEPALPLMLAIRITEE